MTTKTAPPSDIPFIENLHAPEVFATDACGFLVNGGNIHITFATARCSHENTPGPVSRVVIGRLVMPIVGAQNLALGLYDFLKNQGLDPIPQPDKKQIQ